MYLAILMLENLLAGNIFLTNMLYTDEFTHSLIDINTVYCRLTVCVCAGIEVRLITYSIESSLITYHIDLNIRQRCENCLFKAL